MINGDILSVINFLVCAIGVFVCICRMGLMQGSLTKHSIRIQYFMWAMLLVCSGGSFLYGCTPTPIQIALGTGILAHFVIGYPAWKNGPPLYTTVVRKTTISQSEIIKHIERRYEGAK